MAEQVTDDSAMPGRAAEPFFTLIERTPFGIYVVDEQMRLLQVSAGTRKVLPGVDALIGRNFGDAMRAMFTDEFADEAHRRFTETLATGEPYRAPTLTERRRDNGATESFDWMIERIRLPDGAHGVVCYFYDMTERRYAEDALHALQAAGEHQRRVYEAILDNTPDLAYVFDLEHRFTYANQGLLSMWGKTWDESIGKTCLQLGYEPWHAAMHDREIDTVVSTRKPIRGEVPFEGTFGRRIYDYIFVPVLGDSGEVVAVAGTTRDVTERKRDEEELRDAAEELTLSDQRKDEFLAILAHELRNPLAPMRNALEIVRRSPEDASVIDAACGMMERQLGHMVRLVDDLMDLSRVSRGHIELRREPVELAEVIRQAIENCRPAIKSARHEVDVDLPRTPIRLNADPVRLAQVFANLLNNACKYSEAGGRVRISAECGDETVTVRMKDGGIGIAPDMLPRIFDMFTQGNRGSQRSQGGLGIGLTLVKTLVEMHGGRVTAASEGPGKGSEFTVTLPLAAAKPAPALVAGAARRILVVDDNRDSAISLATLLELGGHETHTAFDGLDAVRAAALINPDVVLLDLGMPLMDGYEACREIRRRAAGRNMALIALTGWGQEEDRRRSQEAGFDAHLVKPVDIALLGQLLAGLSVTQAAA